MGAHSGGRTSAPPSPFSWSASEAGKSMTAMLAPLLRYRGRMPGGEVRDATAPLGRDEVVAAILTAAADLFAERGPTATSIRNIATLAGVNDGLIHRHFGSKDRLVGAVLDYLGQYLADLAATETPARRWTRRSIDSCGSSPAQHSTGTPSASCRPDFQHLRKHRTASRAPCRRPRGSVCGGARQCTRIELAVVRRIPERLGGTRRCQRTRGSTIHR